MRIDSHTSHTCQQSQFCMAFPEQRRTVRASAAGRPVHPSELLHGGCCGGRPAGGHPDDDVAALQLRMGLLYGAAKSHQHRAHTGHGQLAPGTAHFKKSSPTAIFLGPPPVPLGAASSRPRSSLCSCRAPSACRRFAGTAGRCSRAPSWYRTKRGLSSCGLTWTG